MAIKKNYILLLIFAFTSIAWAKQKVHYDVHFPEYKAHYVNVKMKVYDLVDDTLRVKMPVWTPGSYKIREFSKNVERVSVTALNGEKLEINKSDKNTWVVDTKDHSGVIIDYHVYANERSVRTSLIDSSHAFLSPTSIFLYPNKGLRQSSTLTFHLPAEWSTVSTALIKNEEMPHTYTAKNYHLLYDTPMEIGNQEVFGFEASGVHHDVAMFGGGNYNKAKIKEDFSKIVKACTAVFDSNPNKYYLFIIHNYAAYRGGLEHLNSTVCGASRDKYKDPENYRNFLSLIAHEYFHLWNVKRLRPAPLGDFDYEKENYTTGLWVAEGYTSYYDNLLLYRTNIVDQEKYFSILANDIAAFRNKPAHRIQSLKDSSFDTWIKFYHPNENTVNSNISYYLKGSLVAFCMDIEIIEQSKGKYSLDDVMKYAYEKFYLLENKPFTDEEFIRLAEEKTGLEWMKFYEQYVKNPGDIPFEKILKKVGLKLTDVNKDSKNAFLGVELKEKQGKFIVSRVYRDSPAWKEGINVGDELISVNDKRVTDKNFEDAFSYDEEVEVMISRDGLLKKIKVTLVLNERKKYIITVDEKTKNRYLKNRSTWLSQ